MQQKCNQQSEKCIDTEHKQSFIHA